MRGALLTTLAFLVACVAGGCVGPDPRFDLIPGPLSLRQIWVCADDPLRLSDSDWQCVDDAHRAYLREYLELIRREGTPLVRGFRGERSDAWRADPGRIERLAARQTNLIDAMARLDDVCIGQLESCGLDQQWIARLRVEREIVRTRIVIEGHGPSLVDLRALLDLDTLTALSPEARAALDAYAAQLAATLPALRDAERLRPARIARALARMEAEDAARPEEDRLPIDRRNQLAKEEAAVAVRRALTSVLDLNARTLETLNTAMSAEAFEKLRRRFNHAVDIGSWGADADPAVEWQVLVVVAADATSEDGRAVLLRALDQFRERDEALRASLVQSLRSGAVRTHDDPRRVERRALRNELVERALSYLPQEQAQRLGRIRQLSAAEFDATVWAIAPGAAERLLIQCPPTTRPTVEQTTDLPQGPDSIAAIFLPNAANEAWLDTLLERCRLEDDARGVAKQLWLDHARMGFAALERPMTLVKERESQLSAHGEDPVAAGRAIEQYFGAIDEVRRLLTVIEERFFDELDPLLHAVDEAARERLRLERRLERERIDWRFVPLAELIGLGSGAGVSVPVVLSAVTLEPHERAIADEILRSHLADLVSEASGFRSEGEAHLRRAFVAVMRHRAEQSEEADMRASLGALATQVRAAVERHQMLHRAVVDEIAAALPERSLEIRRAWRRVAHPELFVGERSLAPLLALADGAVRARADAHAAYASYRRAWLERIDAIEQAMMTARDAAVFDTAPTNVAELRERWREWPEVAATVSIWDEEHARLLRESVRSSQDERLRAQVNAWMRPTSPQHFWITE